MNCRHQHCDGTVTTKRETYKYDSCGLPYVTLRNVEVRRCGLCGDMSVVIPRMEELHRLIANIVVRKPAPLAASEIKFLRKYIGLSQVDFSRAMGVSAETACRWESDKPMGAAADRLLRVMVVINEPVRDYSIDVLTHIKAKAQPTPVHLDLALVRNEWKSKKAA